MTPYTTAASPSFDGASDYSQCHEGGLCYETSASDDGLASGASYVVQTVNAGVVEIRNTSGTLLTSFSLANFVNLAGCANPFDVDAAYDASSDRYVVTSWVSQENNANCPYKAVVNISVSSSGNPTGQWYYYNFDTSQGGQYYFDYPHVGVNASGIYVSGNLIPVSNPSGFYQAYAFGYSKSQLYGNVHSGLMGGAFQSVSWNGTQMDSVLPVKAVGSGPTPEMFVASKNLSWGQCLSTACNGIAVCSLDITRTPAPAACVFANTGQSYYQAPMADNGATCTSGIQGTCIDTGDTRLRASPILRAGQIYTALDDRYPNTSAGSDAGFLYMKITPSLDANGMVSSVNESDAEFGVGSGGDVYYPALMVDVSGNVVAGMNYSDTHDGPSAAYAQIATSTGPVSGLSLMYAQESTLTVPYTRWGDYSAASTDGTNNWFAVSYSCQNPGNLNRVDWCTRIFKDNAG